MPIELPNLDDRTFADLVEEGRNMIAAVAPSWTDHNPSDPGITMLEAFAAVTEQLIYRTNRITNAHKNVFLRLIQPPPDAGNSSSTGEATALPPQQIDAALAEAIRAMRVEERAVTAADYEQLARNAGAVCARCLPRSKVVPGDKGIAIESEVGHVTLVVAASNSGPESESGDALARRILMTLSRVTALTTGIRLLGAKAPATLHVVPAQRLPVALRISLVCLEEYRAGAGATLDKLVKKTLNEYFDIETGGPQLQGWPLGQAVYKSTLYALISEIPGVDYITALQLSVDSTLLGAEANGVTPASHQYVGLEVTCSFSHEQETGTKTGTGTVT